MPQDPLPTPPEDDVVDRYIEFLKKHKDIPQKISSLIASVRECKTPHDLISNWAEYLHFIKEAHIIVTNEIELCPKLMSPAFVAAAGLGAFILGIANPLTLTAAALVGASTGHVLAAKYIKFKTTEDPQWRLVAKLNELEVF